MQTISSSSSYSAHRNPFQQQYNTTHSQMVLVIIIIIIATVYTHRIREKIYDNHHQHQREVQQRLFSHFSSLDFYYVALSVHIVKRKRSSWHQLNTVCKLEYFFSSLKIRFSLCIYLSLSRPSIPSQLIQNHQFSCQSCSPNNWPYCVSQQHRDYLKKGDGSAHRCEIDFFKHRSISIIISRIFSWFDLIVYGWDINNLLHSAVCHFHSQKKSKRAPETGYDANKSL